jgi:hypothetical protein
VEASLQKEVLIKEKVSHAAKALSHSFKREGEQIKEKTNK